MQVQRSGYETYTQQSVTTFFKDCFNLPFDIVSLTRKLMSLGHSTEPCRSSPLFASKCPTVAPAGQAMPAEYNVRQR